MLAQGFVESNAPLVAPSAEFAVDASELKYMYCMHSATDSATSDPDAYTPVFVYFH